MKLRQLLSHFYDPDFIRFIKTNHLLKEEQLSGKLSDMLHRVNSPTHLEYLHQEFQGNGYLSFIESKQKYLSTFEENDVSPKSVSFIRDMFYANGSYPLVVKDIKVKKKTTKTKARYQVKSNYTYDYAVVLEEGEITKLAVDYNTTLVDTVKNLDTLKTLVLTNSDTQSSSIDNLKTLTLCLEGMWNDQSLNTLDKSVKVITIEEKVENESYMSEHHSLGVTA